MRVNFPNILKFLAIILFQVLILNKIALRWWAQPFGFPVFVPFIYPLFVLLLRFDTPVWALLLIGFFTGLSVDMFMNTPGMHALAMVLIAYSRNRLLQFLLPKNLHEYSNQAPGIKSMGWLPFLVYASILILIHHSAFFLVEAWSLTNAGRIAIKLFASSVTSLALIVACMLLFGKQGKLRGN